MEKSKPCNETEIMRAEIDMLKTSQIMLLQEHSQLTKRIVTQLEDQVKLSNVEKKSVTDEKQTIEMECERLRSENDKLQVQLQMKKQRPKTTTSTTAESPVITEKDEESKHDVGESSKVCKKRKFGAGRPPLLKDIKTCDVVNGTLHYTLIVGKAGKTIELRDDEIPESYKPTVTKWWNIHERTRDGTNKDVAHDIAKESRVNGNDTPNDTPKSRPLKRSRLVTRAEKIQGRKSVKFAEPVEVFQL